MYGKGVKKSHTVMRPLILNKSKNGYYFIN